MLLNTMPLPIQEQEVQLDFGTHPQYRQLFDTLLAGGQNREQATLLLADLWHWRANINVPQQQVGPQLHEPQQPQQQHNPGDEALQQGHVDHNKPKQPNQLQPPRQPPIQDHREQLGAHHQDHHQAQAPHPFLPKAPPVPQDLPPVPDDDQDGFTPDKADK